FDRIKNEVTNEINFYTVDVGRMLDPSLGQSSRNLEQIFEDLKKVCQKGSSVFLLLDELDTFCMSRSRINEHDAIRRSMTTLMMELDKLHPSTTTKFLIFGITNVPELVDTAVVRRFSLKKNIDPQLNLDEFQSYLTYLNQSIKYEIKQDKVENLYKIYLNRQFTVGDIKALYKVLYLDLMCDNITVYKDDHLLKLFESGFSTKEHLSKTYIKELVN
ncbi:MAG: AAA family ATPase, partial [Snowella sp.]|nr:AAA family ATPase [Snowella sp.]